MFVIVLIVGWWILGAYNFLQPSPQRPDANFTSLINDFDSYPTEIWLVSPRNTCLLDEYFKGRCRRYVVLESSGRVIYDYMTPREAHKKGLIPADNIPDSVEYQRAAVTLQGVVLRENTLNLCQAVKEGSRYRLVHISERIYNPLNEV